MSYLIYARKYRPKTFDEMIGQNAVKKTLKNAVENDRVAQAYIFSGMRGVGKTTAARIFAKALNCEHGPIPTPCNECTICNEINDDRSIDVLEIDGASNTGVDDVRALREGVQYKPIKCRYKIIIIDEIHMLTKNAFNALLKTLEEPPQNTVFIFATTEFHKLPATIVSRCQHFEFKKILHKEIREHLIDITKRENIQVSSAGINLLADAAEGSLRDAQSLLDQAVAFSGERIEDKDLKEILGTINRDMLFDYSSAILEERPENIFSLIEQTIDSGYDLRFFYSEIILHFRNLLLLKSIESPGDLLPLDDKELDRLKQEVAKANLDELLQYIMSLQQWEPGLRYSSHPRIYLETQLVKLCHFKKIKPLKDLINEVKELRNEIKSGEKRPEINRSVSENSVRDSQGFGKKGSSWSDSRENKPTRSYEQKQKLETDVDKTLQDPSVKNFMDTFKAQILSVEPKKNNKE